MKTKIKYLLILVLASFVFAGCCTTHGKKTTQWEYKTAKVYMNPDVDDKYLNAMAKDGWEIVSTSGVPSSGNEIVIFFKRPKQ